MRKFLSIAMTTALALTVAVDAFAGVDGRKALKQLNNIRNGNNTQDQIRKLRVRETATFGSNVTFGANSSVTIAKDITFTGSVTVVSNVVGSNGESWDNITDGTIAERWDDTGSTNKGSKVYGSDSVGTNADDNATFEIKYQMLNDGGTEVIDWIVEQFLITDTGSNSEDSAKIIFIQSGGNKISVGTWDGNGLSVTGRVNATTGYQMKGVAGGQFAFTNYNGAAQTNIVYIDFINGCSNVVVAAP